MIAVVVIDVRVGLRAAVTAGAYGEPEDLAVLAVFLASPLAHYISGAVIPVDGGLRRYAF